VLISVVVAQVPVGWDIDTNLASLRDVVAQVRPGDLVVLPEGLLSGYDADLSPLAALDRAALAGAIAEAAALARKHRVHLFCGSLLPVGDFWANAALHFGPDGERGVYEKINLAMNERGALRPGDRLRPLPVGDVSAGVQICREIRFPEQWQHLVRTGAQVFVYLTNAANTAEAPGVWRSHLVSRAAENQRFLVSANAAHPDQHCPTMIVSPRGAVIGELPAGVTATLRRSLDLSENADWYQGQRRLGQLAAL
jgi:predicted amidohydrolase